MKTNSNRNKQTILAALTVCVLSTVQSQADLTWQGGSGYWYSGNWTDGGTPNQGWSGSVAYIGNVGVAPSPITLNGWVGADIHTYNSGYLNTDGNGLTGNIYVEDSTRFAIVGNNPHPSGLTLAKGDLQLGYGGNDTPCGGDIVVNAGNLELAAQATSGKTIAGNLYVNGGNVNYQFNNQIGDTATIYARGGTINLGAKSDTVGGLELSSGSAISNGTLTSTSTYDVRKGSVSAVLAGTVGLTKSTADTVTLSGANSYTGTTSVDQGTLLVNNSSGSGTGSGTVSVSSGATLGGTGTITGTLGVTGIIAPGNSIGTLTVGSTTWNSGDNWQFELGTPASSDKLVINGDFLKGSGSTFQFDFMGSTPTLGTYTLIDWSASLSGFNLDASNFSFTGLTGYTGSYFTINGSQLDFTVVPELSNVLIGGLLGVGLLRRRRGA